MVKPVIYVFVNKSLGMTAGKLAAQASHAVAMVMADAKKEAQEVWLNAPHKTMLIMQARDEQHIDNIEQYLLDRGITTEKIIDEGVNEIDAHSVTALATCILDREDEEDMLTMSSFDLYRDSIKLTMEIDR